MNVRLTLTAALLVLGCGVRAHAQAGAAREVSLTLPDCEASTWRQQSLRSALELELESTGHRLRPQLGASSWRIEIASVCAPDAAAPLIRIHAPDGSVLTREVALADTPPDLHARTLALAAAEQLRTQTQGAPPAAAKPSTSLLTLALWPTLRVFLAERHPLIGAELSLRVQRWLFGIAGLGGSFSDPLGSLNAGQLTFGLRYALLRADAADLRISLGPRIAAGVLWAGAAGNPESRVEAPLTAFIWDAGAVLSADYVFGRFGLGARIAGGYARGARIHADERVLAELTGLFVDAAIGVSLAL